MKLIHTHVLFEGNQLVIAYNDNPMNPVRRAILNADKSLTFENEGCEEIKQLVKAFAEGDMYNMGLSGFGQPLRYTRSFKISAWKKYTHDEARKIAFEKARDYIFSFLIQGKDAKIGHAGSEMTHFACYVWHE